MLENITVDLRSFNLQSIYIISTDPYYLTNAAYNMYK